MAARIVITKQGEKYNITYKSGQGLVMQPNRLYVTKSAAYKAIAGFIQSIYGLGGIEATKVKRLKATNVITFMVNGNPFMLPVTDKTVLKQEPIMTKPRHKAGQSQNQSNTNTAI